jgi:hypothetical protein
LSDLSALCAGVLAMLCAATVTMRAQSTPPPPTATAGEGTGVAAAAAVPRDPATAIKEAFETHPLVALGDNHGNEQVHDLRLTLIRDSRLAGVFNDIVVEFGNARYQDLMDRFISGETVAADDLRYVWQDTTQIEEAWDLPIYEEFFRAVRQVNKSRRPDQRLRVLLGDPPIDWSAVRSGDDLESWMDRDGHAVTVIRREVLARKRRGLIIYGDQHLVRKNTRLDAADDWANGVVARLEKDGSARVFNIHTDTRLDMTAIQGDIATWTKPSLTMLRGTTLGQTVMEPGPGRKPVQMQEQFDAIVYLGSPGTMTIATLSPALCANERYLAMRSSRLTLRPAPGDAPFNPADRLKARCAFPKTGPPVVDTDPTFTGIVRAALLDAQQGQSNPDRFAPDLRHRLVLFAQRYGPRILGPMGELKALTLIGDAAVAGQHLRRYRAEFVKGKMIWTIGVSPDNTIASMDPSREP